MKMDIEDQNEPYPCIIIRGSEDIKIKPTRLFVFKPVVDAYPIIVHPEKSMHISNWSEEATKESAISFTDTPYHTKVLILKSHLHDIDKTCSAFTLPNRCFFMSGSSWKAPPSKLGEVSFHVSYWEWAEDILGHYARVLKQAKIYVAVHSSLFTYVSDKNVLQAFLELWCPSTNTLHTAAGELSISLSDVRSLCGLPVRGEFYDEVVPTAKELLGNDSRESLLPRSCKYLFMAYHKLPHDSVGVSVSDWVSFWFKGSTRYSEPPPRTSRKRLTKPRLLRNPCGRINVSLLVRPKEYEEPFETLQIEEDMKEETYLAAFISCWLCHFVLPHRRANRIRATVFKVASRMARGDTFSLAIPVLTSIYRGLRDISTSINLSESTAIFSIHYLYSWTGQYLNTHHSSKIEPVGAYMVKYAGENMARYFGLTEARDLFHNIAPSDLLQLRFHQERQISVIDKAGISDKYKDLFLALRSSYLTFRTGEEHIVEAYSPHRFSRQHGFYQDIPGTLKREILSCDLDELVRLWVSCTSLGTSSKLTLPGDASPPPLISKEYYNWWQKCWKATSTKNTKIILKIGHSVAQEPASGKTHQSGNKMPERKQTPESSRPQENSSKSSKDLKRKSDLLKEQCGLLENQEVEVAHQVDPLKGNEVISALLSSSEGFSDHYQLKKRPKQLLSVEEEAKTTSGGTMHSVNEASLLDFIEGTIPIYFNDSDPQEIMRDQGPNVEVLMSTHQVPSCLHPTPTVSEFCPQGIKIAAGQLLIKFLWEQILRASFEEILQIKKIDELVEEMGKHIEDISIVKDQLKSFFDGASNFVKVKLSSTLKKTQVHENMLCLAQQDLSEAESRESKQVELMQSFEAELLQLTKEEEGLKEQLVKLGTKKETANLSFRQTKESLSKAREDVAAKREMISKIEGESFLSKEEIGTLKKMEAELEDSRRDLTTFNLYA